MTGVDWQRVADVFADALELPPDERADFVERRCRDHPEDYDAVQRMLAAATQADPAFLGGMDPRYLADVVGEAAEPLERIGPWRIVGEIGRGGMGQVLLAERADGQFNQRVAIKLLKRGMDSDAILARFLQERQILAGLDHPNIARLFDGGVADDGRPYLVMEHVDGKPLTAFADERRLSVDARLGVFHDVCHAVEYAHRNLVVHRDLKPSNILVTPDGRVKLLDFGIAKLLAATGHGADGDPLTTDGVRLMTPAYAAPEQVHGGQVTTSTDVYGLGAVLFELLSGRRPFDDATERLDRPRDSEPVPLPSAVERLPARPAGTEAPSPSEVAAARSTEPRQLVRRLAGDLEVIVATALRSSPERRYASVDALHQDLRRHQERLPVRARPDSLTYRVSRFVARHRTGVLATASLITLVVAFAVTSAWQASLLALERDRARHEADAAREVSEFLVSVFEVADPMQPGQGDSIRATDLLERGAARIERELADQPLIQARMLGVIGRAFDNLQRGDRAEPLLARAVELQRAHAEVDTAALVHALRELAVTRGHLGDFPAAEAALGEAIDLQASVQPEGSVMWSLSIVLANIHHGTGDYDRGRASVADAMAMFDRLPADSLRGGEELWRLAKLLQLGRGPAGADSVFARLIDVERDRFGDRSPNYAAALRLWAHHRSTQGDARSADSLLTLATDLLVSLDSTSTAVASVLQDRASLALRRGDSARADSIGRRAIAIFRDRLGDEHRAVAISRSTVADALLRLGRLDESIEMRRLALAAFRRDPDDAATLLPVGQSRLAVALRDAGRLDEAIPLFEESLAAFTARYPDDYLLTANLRRDLGEALVLAGRASDAEPMLRRATEVLGARWGELDVRADVARISLGRARTELGRYAEADTLLGNAYARLAAARGEDDVWTRRAREALDDLERARTRAADR